MQTKVAERGHSAGRPRKGARSRCRSGPNDLVPQAFSCHLASKNGVGGPLQLFLSPLLKCKRAALRDVPFQL